MPELIHRRVAVITNSPAPYRDQLFNRLGPLVGTLDVYYTQPATSDRAWSTDPVDAEHRLRPIGSFGSLGSWNYGVVKAVRSHDVVIVGGYDQLSYVVALVVAKALRKRTVMIFDGLAPSRIHRREFRTLLKSVIVRRADVCLTNGAIGRRYFAERLKVPASRIRNQYLVPVETRPPTPSTRRFDVVFVGRLIERKRVDLLIEASKALGGVTVGIVGDGPLYWDLRRQARGTGVEFLGDGTAMEVAQAMSGARCVVVPSVDEPWGLVVHEAMAHQTPVVVGLDMGCVEDLVVDGSNGVILRDYNAESLVAAIRSALALDRAEVSSTNSRVLELWNLEHHVEAFRSAIEGSNEPHEEGGDVGP